MRYGPNFIYSYRNGRNDGDELRYSLRSLHQNFFSTSPLRIVVVGDKPSWYTGEHVSSTPVGEKYRDILKNVILGLRQTYNDGRVHYMDDDYFLLDPTDHVLLAHRGLLNSHVEDAIAYHGRGHDYTEHLIDTLEFVGPHALDYELHRPMPLQAEHAYEVLTKLWKDTPPGVYDRVPFWRTVYGNFVTGGVKARDGKIGTVNELARGEKLGVPWISGSDALWRGKLRTWITKLFPEPSPWEAVDTGA